ncbi:hypothetical protein [Enterobacter cloacae complex sp. 288G10]
MKLSQNEAMALASVFLRIKPTLKIEEKNHASHTPGLQKYHYRPK